MSFLNSCSVDEIESGFVLPGTICHIVLKLDVCRMDGSAAATWYNKMSNNVAILLAEDDENDIFLMQRAFARAGIPNPLFVARNGQEAVDYMAGTGKFAQRDKFPLPGMVLLDLKLPWMDGFDVLRWMRTQPSFNSVPVVVLTSSKLQADIDRSREFGVYDYRVKPHSFDDLVRLLDDVRKCWLEEPVA